MECCWAKCQRPPRTIPSQSFFTNPPSGLRTNTEQRMGASTACHSVRDRQSLGTQDCSHTNMSSSGAGCLVRTDSWCGLPLWPPKLPKAIQGPWRSFTSTSAPASQIKEETTSSRGSTSGEAITTAQAVKREISSSLSPLRHRRHRPPQRPHASLRHEFTPDRTPSANGFGTQPL